MMQGPDLLNAYLNGEDLTPQQGEALSAWICSSDENSRHAAVLMHLNQSVAEAVRGRNAATLMSDDADPHWVNFFGEDDADQTQAKPSDAQLPPIHLDATALTKEKYLSALSYVVKHTFTPKRVAILATAAALMIGTALTIVLMTGPQPQEQIADSTRPNKPAASTQSTPRGSNPQPVATLTNTRNATWGRPASAGPEHPPTPGSKLQPGDALAAGQRLNLTAGFAEITTARGAIAILEAPATIELIDNNAIRLHHGKLMSICETESSKGFLVRTPHMDITDLGTRFGVDASSVSTQLQVFEGEVEAKRPGAGSEGESILLVSGQSASASADTASFNAIQVDPQRFAALLPPVIQLPGTGQGLSAGEIDSTWQIASIDGQKLDEPLAPRVTDAEAYVQSFRNDPATSQWLAWDTTDVAVKGVPIIYHFQKEFNLPEDIDPANTRLRLRYMADNALAAVVINAHRVEISSPIAAKKFDTWLDAVIHEHLVAGKNTIVFEVVDSPPTGSGNLVGLRLTWQIETISHRLEHIQQP